MRSEAPASEQASAENQEVSSSRKCSGCQKETKNHFGPFGKKCCVVYLVELLRLRVELLEEKLVENEKRHGKAMKEQSALHQKRIDGLLALVESLQEASADRGNENNPASLAEDGGETSPCSSQASVNDTPAAAQAQSISPPTHQRLRALIYQRSLTQPPAGPGRGECCLTQRNANIWLSKQRTVR